MKVQMFYKTGCPYTMKTEELLGNQKSQQSKSIARSLFEKFVRGSQENFSPSGYVKVERYCVDSNPDAYKSTLSSVTRSRISTFPQIFVDDVYVGGYTEFSRYMALRQ